MVLVGDAAYCASPMSGQGTSIALIGAYVLAGELAAASGAHPRAFAEFENVMRPFVEANQALGLRSSKLMRSGEKKSVVGWLLTGLGAAIILAGILMNLDIYFRQTSLFNTLMMLGMLFGGLGLIARSLRGV